MTTNVKKIFLREVVFLFDLIQILCPSTFFYNSWSTELHPVQFPAQAPLSCQKGGGDVFFFSLDES